MKQSCLRKIPTLLRYFSCGKLHSWGYIGIGWKALSPIISKLGGTVYSIYIYTSTVGSIQPRALHPLPNAKDLDLLPHLLPCFCFSWSPSPGSSMIVAVFLFSSYRTVSTGKSSLANDYLPWGVAALHRAPPQVADSHREL